MRKPKQKVEQKFEIPEVFLARLKGFSDDTSLTTDHDLCVAEYLLKMLDEIDATKQTAHLKKAIDNLKQLLSGDGNNETTVICLQVLCYIFMDCDCKNPCRRTIASFFQAQENSYKLQLLGYMNDALLTILKEIMEKAAKSSEDVNFRKHVDTICSLLENFPLGENCISANTITVLEFLATSLECLVVRESLVGTPAMQTTAMLDCLVTVKAVMNVIQKCAAEETLQEETFLALNQRFAGVIVKILGNDAFFPDCRNAAGMALPLLVRTVTTEETLVPIIMSLFFPSYINQERLQQTTISSHWLFISIDRKTIKDMSGFSYLSICRGVMAMVPKDLLFKKHNFIHKELPDDFPGTLLVDVLFPEITSLCAELKDSNALVAFRTLANWTSQIREAVGSASVDDCFKSRLVGSSAIAKKLLNFVWNYWDHPMEAMRYHTREIFDNIVKTHLALTAIENEPMCDTFMQELTNKLCNMDWFIRGKYGPLCCLVDILGAQAILNVHPSVPQDLMMVMCDQSIVPHAMEFAEKVFNNHLAKLSTETEQYFDKWFEIWVIPGLQCLSSGDKSSRKHVTEYYIPKLLKCCPECLKLMINKLQEPVSSSKGIAVSRNVGGLVTCLKTARHLGLLPRTEILNDEQNKDNENVLWQDTIPVTVLEQSLCHLDDEIRSDVLGLICDSVRTTELLSERDLELLRNFYPANMNSQSPSFRQRALGITKKLFIRLCDGGRSLKKKVSDGKCNMELYTKQVNLYVEFLHWFARLQFESLFPGSSFCRRTTALQNLILLLQIFPINLKNEDSFSIFECCEVFSSDAVLILLDCLKGTYDVNKQMAFDLLVACPSSVQPFSDASFASEWTRIARQSAVSPKAINVSTAAYMFKLLIYKSPHDIVLPTHDTEQTEKSGTRSRDEFQDAPGEESGNEWSEDQVGLERNERKSTIELSGKSGIGQSQSQSRIEQSQKSGVGQSQKSGVGQSQKSGVGQSQKSGVGQSQSQSRIEQSQKSGVGQSDIEEPSKTNEGSKSDKDIGCQLSEMSLSPGDAETLVPRRQHFCVLSQLLKILRCQIDVARKSLLHAAFEAPIHGVLYCLREIICDFELSEIAGDKHWQSLVMEIIKACYDVTDVVSPVVTNSSPEGNITVDNSELDNGDDVVEPCEEFAPRAQILLVCCWRAMKEVSLLLGEITKRSPVKEQDGGHGLLSFNDFEVIGQLFTKILVTSKHRGAYELAHEGFLKLCHMLWRCKQRDLQSLPEKLLRQLLGDICSDNPTAWLCGTRRSAGLPFFFKAIITTEPSSTGKCCFNAVMKELLNTAAKPVPSLESNEDTTLPQVHARNILRALYKETKLGEDVYPYVADGVQVAVEGFLSDSWAIRNSSTLLFSALMNRMFGPQKFQEEKRRQGMTGREFFSRFPLLHSFLVKQLEMSVGSVESESSKSSHLYPSLYPVLLLLSRLHPSAMDGNDSTLNMAAFIPYVLRCSRSFVLKTRAMAARALVPLVSGEALPDMFQKLAESLPVSEKSRVCQNHVHGCLLQIRNLLTSVSTNTSLSLRTKQAIFEKLVPLFLQRIWLASSLNPCDMTRAVMLSIFRTFVVDRTWITRENHMHVVDSTASITIQNTSTAAIENVTQELLHEALHPPDINVGLFPIGRTFVNEEIARLALHPILEKSRVNQGVLDPTDVSQILGFLSSLDYEVVLVALEFLCEIFDNLKDGLDVIVRELLRQVIQPTMKSSCLSQAYKCLSLVPRLLRFPWTFADRELVDLSEGWRHILLAYENSKQRSEIMCSLIQFSSTLVNQVDEKLLSETCTDETIPILETWVTYVESCAASEESEALRLTVSQVLGSDNLLCILTGQYHVYGSLPFRLWKIVVQLLLDDSVDVKVSMATCLTNVFQAVHQGDYSSMHSALALRHVATQPLLLYWTESPSSCLAWLLSLLTGDSEDGNGDTTAYDDLTTMDRLFAKGPLNTFAEDCIVTEIVFTTFISWVTSKLRASENVCEKFLSLLKDFIESHFRRCDDESMPQDSLYSELYKTLAGLAMMQALLKHCEDGVVEFGEYFNKTVSFLREIRTRDSGRCFSHLKLQTLADSVLGKL